MSSKCLAGSPHLPCLNEAIVIIGLESDPATAIQCCWRHAVPYMKELIRRGRVTVLLADWIW